MHLEACRWQCYVIRQMVKEEDDMLNMTVKNILYCKLEIKLSLQKVNLPSVVMNGCNIAASAPWVCCKIWLILLKEGVAYSREIAYKEGILY